MHFLELGNMGNIQLSGSVLSLAPFEFGRANTATLELNIFHIALLSNAVMTGCSFNIANTENTALSTKPNIQQPPKKMTMMTVTVAEYKNI